MAKKRPQARDAGSHRSAQPGLRRPGRHGRRRRDLHRRDTDRAAVEGGGRGRDGRDRRPGWPTCRSGCSRRAPRRSAPRAADPAGHGHLRQGRGDQPRPRDGQSGRRPHGVVQEADQGGTRPRLPLADREAGPGSRVSSASSTARSTRTCWSSGCTTWSRRTVWSQRYAADQRVRAAARRRHVTIVKCFLHISKDVQTERLLARLEDPTKYWKYNPGDVDERGYWDSYQQAYSAALQRATPCRRPGTSSRRTGSGTGTGRSRRCCTETLEAIDPAYPPADFDIETEKRRVRKADPAAAVCRPRVLERRAVRRPARRSTSAPRTRAVTMAGCTDDLPPIRGRSSCRSSRASGARAGSTSTPRCAAGWPWRWRWTP